jgi:hypothetical protein
MAIECEVGVHLEVDVGSDTWKPAMVTEVGEKGVRYHLTGWGDQTDKWLTARSQMLRLPGGSRGIDWVEATPPPPPAASGGGGGGGESAAAASALNHELQHHMLLSFIRALLREQDPSFAAGGLQACRARVEELHGERVEELHGERVDELHGELLGWLDTYYCGTNGEFQPLMSMGSAVVKYGKNKSKKNPWRR